MRDQNFGMLLIEPCRDGIRRRTKNGPDPSLVQAVQHSLHPRELEITIARLPTTPRRLPDPHHCDASLLHHLDIFVEPVMGHVFRVVSDTVEDGVHLVGSEG